MDPADHSQPGKQPPGKPQEGRDYYYDPDGLLVFTGTYLLQRGYCCGNGCRHCPYENQPNKQKS